MAALVLRLQLRCEMGHRPGLQRRDAGALHAVADLRWWPAVCMRPEPVTHQTHSRHQDLNSIQDTPSPADRIHHKPLAIAILDEQLRANPTRKEEARTEAHHHPRAEQSHPGRRPSMTCTTGRRHSSRQQGPDAPRIGFPRPGESVVPRNRWD